ncbi:high-affinity nitrate transporter 3.1-like [Rutidosis leptorrhynchoides]|uniref:high-affinity nitrate transporter 3.1-like n=1 Tax=Rutidosis leptorrhynchoides TaxID=125765 RepID=UPI003A99D131
MKSLLLKTFVILFLSKISNGDMLFSSLPESLFVVTSASEGQVLRAGEDNIIVTFGLNQTITNQTDESYKITKVKLCYAPISQVDRKWRRTIDNLKKDKTCQFTIYDKTYERNVEGFKWEIQKDTPTATYFVRVYAYSSEDEEIAFGQTTNDKKTENLFKIQGISGRHVSLDIASICFSGFALLSLVGFFVLEKRQSKVKG